MKLIVEMDMPKSCRSCKLCVFIGSSPVCPLRKYPFDTVSQYFYADKKPTYCPIKGVLPDEHGRLIDADELKTHVRNVVKEIVDNSPTIVQAERKDDEQDI